MLQERLRNQRAIIAASIAGSGFERRCSIEDYEGTTGGVQDRRCKLARVARAKVEGRAMLMVV